MEDFSIASVQPYTLGASEAQVPLRSTLVVVSLLLHVADNHFCFAVVSLK